MFLPASIQIGKLVLNNSGHAGAVSIGAAAKLNRNVSAKQNQGFGQQCADGTLRIANVQLMLDDESSDFYSFKTNGRQEI
jgi:hypothetical protein